MKSIFRVSVKVFRGSIRSSNPSPFYWNRRNVNTNLKEPQFGCGYWSRPTEIVHKSVTRSNASSGAGKGTSSTSMGINASQEMCIEINCQSAKQPSSNGKSSTFARCGNVWSFMTKQSIILLLLLCHILLLNNGVNGVDFNDANTDDVTIDPCPNSVRKSWHLTSDQEKQLYIRGIHELNHQGKLDYFAQTHHEFIDMKQGHFSSAFLPWHRYLLWEFEQQIRSLGGEFECFSVPYWDVSSDAGEFESAYILNSGLGGKGNEDNYDCVDDASDGVWSRDVYPSKNLCRVPETALFGESNCCLKRAGGQTDVASIAKFSHVILNHASYGGQNHGFRVSLQKLHANTHTFIGGMNGDYTHMISKYGPDDPIFWLLHCYFDYLWVVWQQCHGYDAIDAMDLDSHEEAYKEWISNDVLMASGLDDKLYFNPMNGVDWWSGDDLNPTPRMMFHGNNALWNVRYEEGTFVELSKMKLKCKDNPKWKWESNELVDNSIETKEMIGSSDLNDVSLYAENAWQEVNDDIDNWNSKMCSYQSQKMGLKHCQIASDLDYEKCEKRGDFTLNELLDKDGVKGNDCLETVRVEMYSYAKSYDLLFELCNGYFDDLHVCQAPLLESNEFVVDNSHKLKGNSNGIVYNGYIFVSILLSAFAMCIMCQYMWCYSDPNSEYDECDSCDYHQQSIKSSYGSVV